MRNYWSFSVAKATNRPKAEVSAPHTSGLLFDAKRTKRGSVSANKVGRCGPRGRSGARRQPHQFRLAVDAGFWKVLWRWVLAVVMATPSAAAASARLRPARRLSSSRVSAGVSP